MEVEVLLREGPMTLSMTIVSCRSVYTVRGPARQEKAFRERRDAENYFRYYANRCRREAGLSPGERGDLSTDD